MPRGFGSGIKPPLDSPASAATASNDGRARHMTSRHTASRISSRVAMRYKVQDKPTSRSVAPALRRSHGHDQPRFTSSVSLSTMVAAFLALCSARPVFAVRPVVLVEPRTAPRGPGRRDRGGS